MNAGDRVQVRQQDDSVHWIYAMVIDPATRQVKITHPGNREDGVVKLVAADEIRTKADVQTILGQVPVNGAQLSNAQITALGALDPWVLQYLKPGQEQSRVVLHSAIAKHYQEQAKRLS